MALWGLGGVCVCVGWRWGGEGMVRGGGTGGRGGSFQNSSSAASRFCVFNLGITGTTLATKFTTLSLSFSRHLQPKITTLLSLSPPTPVSLSVFKRSSNVYPPPPPHTHTHPSLRPSALCFSFSFLLLPQTFSIRSASLFGSWFISNRRSYQ